MKRLADGLDRCPGSHCDRLSIHDCDAAEVLVIHRTTSPRTADDRTKVGDAGSISWRAEVPSWENRSDLLRHFFERQAAELTQFERVQETRSDPAGCGEAVLDPNFVDDGSGLRVGPNV